MARNLTLADGRLGTTAATVISGADVPEKRVDVLLQNTGTSEETIVLTFQRAGGTARRLARIVLQENEQALARNVPMQPDDTLLGLTTTASTVDYIVQSGGDGSFGIEVYDSRGSGRGIVTMRRLLLGIEHMIGDELPDPGV